MNKMGRREYLKMLCETLVRTYGNTLSESDTDLLMAKAIMSKMTRYLYFRSDMSAKEWITWRRKFLLTNMNRPTKMSASARFREDRDVLSKL